PGGGVPWLKSVLILGVGGASMVVAKAIKGSAPPTSITTGIAAEWELAVSAQQATAAAAMPAPPAMIIPPCSPCAYLPMHRRMPMAISMRAMRLNAAAM